MDDHRRVGGDRRQQVGNRNRVQRHRHALAQTIIAHYLLGQIMADGDDFLGQPVGETTGEQPGIERRHGLALHLEDVPDPLAQRGHIRRRATPGFSLVALGVHQNHDALGRLGGGGHNILRLDQTLGALAQGAQQQFPVGLGVAVGLVQHQHQPLRRALHLPQRLEFAVRDVAIHHE